MYICLSICSIHPLPPLLLVLSLLNSDECLFLLFSYFRQISQTACESLKSNFYISSLLESVTGKAKQQAPSVPPVLTTSFSPPSTVPSEPTTAPEDQGQCDLCSTPGVENLCKECDEKLCMHCSKIHGKSKASSSHILIPVTWLDPEIVSQLKDDDDDDAASELGYAILSIWLFYLIVLFDCSIVLFHCSIWSLYLIVLSFYLIVVFDACCSTVWVWMLGNDCNL